MKNTKKYRILSHEELVEKWGKNIYFDLNQSLFSHNSPITFPKKMEKEIKGKIIETDGFPFWFERQNVKPTDLKTWTVDEWMVEELVDEITLTIKIEDLKKINKALLFTYDQIVASESLFKKIKDIDKGVADSYYDTYERISAFLK